MIFGLLIRGLLVCKLAHFLKKKRLKKQPWSFVHNINVFLRGILFIIYTKMSILQITTIKAVYTALTVVTIPTVFTLTTAIAFV